MLERTLSLRDVFGSIFFVSVGALIDVGKLWEFRFPVLMITFLMFTGKIFGCSLGTILSGYDMRTGLRVVLGLAQIGDFAFIAVKVSSDLGVLSPPLFDSLT